MLSNVAVGPEIETGKQITCREFSTCTRLSHAQLGSLIPRLHSPAFITPCKRFGGGWSLGMRLQLGSARGFPITSGGSPLQDVHVDLYPSWTLNNAGIALETPILSQFISSLIPRLHYFAINTGGVQKCWVVQSGTRPAVECAVAHV